jgi:hypothetical protein
MSGIWALTRRARLELYDAIGQYAMRFRGRVCGCICGRGVVQGTSLVCLSQRSLPFTCRFYNVLQASDDTASCALFRQTQRFEALIVRALLRLFHGSAIPYISLSFRNCQPYLTRASKLHCKRASSLQALHTQPHLVIGPISRCFVHFNLTIRNSQPTSSLSIRCSLSCEVGPSSRPGAVACATFLDGPTTVAWVE